MARRVLPSRLELKRRDGSSSAAPLAKVIFTTFLYVSPVQINPSGDHTGTPLHFHSSTTSGSACLISVRILESSLPRQSPSSLMRSSIIRDAGFLLMLQDVDQLSERITHVEPAHSPRLIRRAVFDRDARI